MTLKDSTAAWSPLTMVYIVLMFFLLKDYSKELHICFNNVRLFQIERNSLQKLIATHFSLKIVYLKPKILLQVHIKEFVCIVLLG